MPLKKTVIIGGTGYIGSAIKNYLPDRTILVFSRHSNPPVDIEVPSSIPIIDADEVIFAAGSIKTPKKGSWDAVNSIGLGNVLKKLKSSTRFIFISSIAAIPPISGVPLTPYGKSKVKAEELLTLYQDKHAITILRPCAVYGGSGFELLTRFIKLYQAYPIFPSKTIALVSLQDLCAAVLLCLDKTESIGKTYNVVENNYTWKEISEFFAKKEGLLLKGGKTLPALPFLEGLFFEWKIDNTPLLNLGWMPSKLPNFP